ncbi:MAG: 30S ribosomal protein S1, partial [bacterium]|nr:30S ribosomal protein S1 [bacterium]
MEIKLEEVMEESQVAQEDLTSSVRRGQLLEGVVVSIDDEGVHLDIGQTTPAIIPPTELAVDPSVLANTFCKVGDLLKAQVIRIDQTDGKVYLSKKRVDEEEGMKTIISSHAANSLVQGKIIETVKGGVMVDLFGVKAFMPASHVDLRYVADLQTFIGQTVSVVIKEIEESRKRVVVSRKEALEQKAAEFRDKAWEALSVGEIVEGTVQRLTDFGAFVDLGGIDGLVHVSEISWERVTLPSEVLTEGQKVKVKIMARDKEKGRISLSLKRVDGDPWTQAASRFNVGQVVDGKIVRTVDFGAFVEIAPGVEGLVHISQLSHTRVEKTEDVVKAGDLVKVKVLSISPDDHKVSLSIKEAVERTPQERTERTPRDRSDNRGEKR